MGLIEQCVRTELALSAKYANFLMIIVAMSVSVLIDNNRKVGHNVHIIQNALYNVTKYGIIRAFMGVERD